MVNNKLHALNEIDVDARTYNADNNFLSAMSDQKKMVTKMKKTVMFSSLQSLTGSQYDELMMDALNIPKGITGLRKFCYANPITKFGMKIQLGRMLSISLIPIVILLIFTGYMFGHHLQASHESNAVSQRLAFATELAGIMHFLQKERDMSALYVSDIGPETKDFLVGHYVETDKALESISVWPIVTSQENKDWQTKDQFTAYVKRHRYELEILQPDSKDELIFYSEIIATFIILLYESTTQIMPGSVWKTLVALTEVVDSRESFGLERALGTLFYSRGGFNSREDYLWFLKSQDQGNHTLQVALEYSPTANQLYTKIREEQDETLSRVIRDMRFKIRSSSVEITNFTTDHKLNGSLDAATMWFNNMTLYIDTLLEMQNQLSAIVLEMLEERYLDARELLSAMAVIFSFVVVITPVILYSVLRLTTDIQEYSIHLADRTKKLNTEKRKTDTLLYQMLPKSVAEKLKHDEVVEPMLYTECTLFYTDIVGFTALSAMSSPVQVVEMLTLFFNVMDDILLRYDVFKVETIGDAYMAASRLSSDKGTKHASEICTMSLEVIDTVAMLAIPHMPGRVFRIRTGCHSGPVIAGVIGLKMPRYCLFGETVTVVTLMESTAKPGFIQISERTNDLLMDEGDFVTECRTDMKILSSNTYWLINKKSMTRLTRKDSLDDKEHSGEFMGESHDLDTLSVMDMDPQLKSAHEVTLEHNSDLIGLQSTSYI